MFMAMRQTSHGSTHSGSHFIKLPYTNEYFDSFFYFLRSWRGYILLFWALFMFWGLFKGPEFHKMAKDGMTAPRHSREWKAQKQFELSFPEKSHELPMIIVFECNAEISQCDVSQDEKLVQLHDKLITTIDKFSAVNDHFVKDYMSYYLYSNSLHDKVKSQFISGDRRVTFLNVVVSDEARTEIRYHLLNQVVRDFIFAYTDYDKTKYSIGVTGFDAIAYDGAHQATALLMKIDMVTVPIGLLLIAYSVGNYRLVLIAVLNVAASVLSSFAANAVIFQDHPPDTITVSLCEVMGLAMSIDYSLFLLRRFRDEFVINKHDLDDSCFIMMYYAGQVVLIAGCSMICVFASFMLLPSEEIAKSGIACVVTICCCMLASLTITPACLFCLPGFFSSFDRVYSFKSFVKWFRSSPPLADSFEPLTTHIARQDLLDIQPIMLKYSGLRFRLTKFITTWPNNLCTLLALFLLIIPFSLQAYRLSTNQNIMQGVPRNSPSGQSFNDFAEAFSGGLLSPFYLLVDSHRGDSVLSEEVFSLSAQLSKAVIRDTACSKHDVNAISYLRGHYMPYQFAVALLHIAENDCGGRPVFPRRELCEVAVSYQYLFKQSVNKEQSASLITIIAPFFPFAEESETLIQELHAPQDYNNSVALNAYVDAVRHELFDQDTSPSSSTNVDKPRIKMFLCGMEVQFNSAMSQTVATFPLLITATLMSSFLVLSLLLQSVLLPLRLTLTLVIPLAGLFGCSVLVYQNGWLDWAGWAAVHSVEKGFYWYVPLSCFDISIGLAYDYNIFLITRVREHRMNGYDIQAAVIKAVCETSGTVSCAAIVMCLAFGGMLLSNQSAVDQFGWLLTTGVLFDAFVVIPFLVPALMSIHDTSNWYPTAVPMTHLKSLKNCEEFLENDTHHRDADELIS